MYTCIHILCTSFAIWLCAHIRVCMYIYIYIYLCIVTSCWCSSVPATPGSFGDASVLVLRCPSGFCTARGSQGSSLCAAWHLSTCGGGSRAGSTYRDWLRGMMGVLQPTWWFHKMGVHPVLIHFRMGFSSMNHPAIGYPHGHGNPHGWKKASGDPWDDPPRPQKVR